MSTSSTNKRPDFEQRLAAAWRPEQWGDVSVVAAVSEGPDSVALLRALAALKTTGPGRLWAAHFNHRLRGQEADEDQAFVDQLCRRLGVACHMGQAEMPVVPVGDGLEAAARQQRYAFFKTGCHGRSPWPLSPAQPATGTAPRRTRASSLNMVKRSLLHKRRLSKSLQVIRRLLGWFAVCLF